MSTSNLLERAFIELETEEWAEANNLLEQVLNIEPRNASAYIGKLMVELRVTEESRLAEQTTPIDGYANFKKAIRFADDEKKAVYNGYNEAIINHISSEKQKVKQESDAFVERAFIELEFEEWDKAAEMLDKALAIDPCNAQAYIGKLMVELRVTHESDLANVTQYIAGYDNYKKAVEYADADKKEVFVSYGKRTKEETVEILRSIIKKYTDKKGEGSLHGNAAHLKSSVFQYSNLSTFSGRSVGALSREWFDSKMGKSIHQNEIVITVIFIENTGLSKKSAMAFTDKGILYTDELCEGFNTKRFPYYRLTAEELPSNRGTADFFAELEIPFQFIKAFNSSGFNDMMREIKAITDSIHEENINNPIYDDLLETELNELIDLAVDGETEAIRQAAKVRLAELQGE